MIIFTSICSNYTHKARLLAESVKRNIPDAKFIVCLTEREIPDNVKFEYFDEIILSKDIWKESFDKFIFKHAIVEASTAVKGRCLQYLIETYQEEEKFIYLDPDCYVYSDFVELRQLLDEKPIVVCPHLLQPGNIDMELSSTAHGVYNLGFLAVRRCEESKKFVDWWTERLGMFCYDDIPRGIFTDQKWVDLAPCFFDVQIFKHRGYDFSIWSLLNCGMEKINGEYFVKGYPLRFIHFSGQGAMAEKCMRDWLPEGDHPFKELYSEYSELHAKSDNDNVSKTPWTYNEYTDGTMISDKIRIGYRDNISWLQIENPFELGNVAIAEKLGFTYSEDSLDVVERKLDANEGMKLISSFFDIWNSGKQVFLYGAGKYGKEFLKFCRTKNLPVKGFLVGDQSGQGECCGLPILSIDDDIPKEDVVVVLSLRAALHNEVKATLREKGFATVLPNVDTKRYNILYQFIKREVEGIEEG